MAEMISYFVAGDNNDFTSLLRYSLSQSNCGSQT